MSNFVHPESVEPEVLRVKNSNGVNFIDKTKKEEPEEEFVEEPVTSVYVEDRSKLSVSERLTLLEEEIETVNELAQKITKTQSKIMSGLSKVMELSTNNSLKYGNWSEEFEKRFNAMYAQQLNMGIVLEVLFPAEEMTAEQKQKVQDKKNEYLKKIQEQSQRRSQEQG